MLPKRVGGVLSESVSRGQWSLQKSNLHINVVELLAIKLALLTFSKMLNLESVHFQINNMSALSCLMKKGGGGGGGYTKQGDRSYFQRDLGICIVQRHHTYCRLPAGKIERQSRLGFQKVPRLKQMATNSFQHSWKHWGLLYAFPPFAMIGKFY